MASTTLRLLWLLLGLALTRQELVTLNTSGTIAAECGKRVALHCNASSSSSSSGGGLSVKHMEWFRGRRSLCSVDGDGRVSTHRHHSLSDFHCDFHRDGRLTLVFRRVLPPESGEYKCKLHSDRGMPSERARVQLQECYGTAEGVLTRDGPSCTFTGVHPDGDVHWFHGARNLSDGSASYQTEKSVDEHGWLTIRSNLSVHGELARASHGAYNCSLRGAASGTYMASALVSGPRAREASRPPTNAVGSQGTLKTLPSILLPLIIVTLNLCT